MKLPTIGQYQVEWIDIGIIVGIIILVCLMQAVDYLGVHYFS